MILKDARLQAIALAKYLERGKVVTIWRVRPRQFTFAEGHGPEGNDTVMIIHASWAQDGWYDKYFPRWGQEAQS